MSTPKKPDLPFAADFNVDELMSKHEAIVDVDPLETMEMEEAQSRFITDKYKDQVLDGNEVKFEAGRDDKGKPLRGVPGVDPFSNYAEKMMNVTIDGKVKKQILRKGCGIYCPEDANVVVLYNAYLEFGQLPFDSTILHGPCKSSLDAFVQGLGVGIRTMMKKEQAQFLVHPDMAYRALGVPPRIPKDATILYEVELVDFTEIKNESDKTEATGKPLKSRFELAMAAARKEYDQGNEHYKKDAYREASKHYFKSLKLEKCNLANEEEQKEQEKLLLKLYLNLAVCWNKLLEPRSACNMCRAALRLDNKNIKALITWGRALIILSEFHEARSKLNQALKLDPGSEDILNELKELDEKEKRTKEQERLFSRKAFL